MRIYIDTSVIGGYFDEEFQEWSQKLFEEFRSGKKTAIISDVTLGELEDAPLNVNRADILVSWNFKHIVNYKLIRLYNSVNLKYGYPVLEIRTPRETIEPK